MNMDAWRKLRFYVRYTWRSGVLRRPEPLFYGIAVTDRCNLACRGCRVAVEHRHRGGCHRELLCG